jgi:Sulfotransferase family
VGKQGRAGNTGRRLTRRLTRIEEALAAESERGAAVLAGLERVAERRAADGALGAGLDETMRLRRESAVPVEEPLALICQAQRSGGTLLARLFDGHPQCHVHPHELHIGDRRPHQWPALPLDEEPEAWFAKLKEDYIATFFTRGRRRIPLKGPGERPEGRHYPFLLPPALQRLIFLEAVARRAPIESERQILDSYMTSLFNAWLDNQNLVGAEKRWVVAFSPRRAWGEGREKFFELYPEGRLISILRDPLSWYTSAQGRDPDADVGGLLELWTRSATEMLESERRYGERVAIIRFEELVLDTPATMRRLAGFLGIDFDPQLTTPTFNRFPVGANSSYGVDRTGVVTDPVERYKELLSEEQQTTIHGQCEELYQEVLAVAERQTAARQTAARKTTPRKPAPRKTGPSKPASAPAAAKGTDAQRAAPAAPGASDSGRA